MTAILGTTCIAVANDDYQAWASLDKKLYSQGPFTLSFYTEVRLREEGHQAFGYFFGPRVQYRIKKYLAVGGAAKMIHFKGSGSGFARLQRYEGEATFNFKLAPRFSYAHRNRYEYIRREAGANSERWRSRIRFTVPVKGTRLVNKFFFGNEFFYDLRNGNFTENRIVPIGAGLKTNSKVSCSIYYLIQDSRSSSSNNHVLGTALSF